MTEDSRLTSLLLQQSDNVINSSWHLESLKLPELKVKTLQPASLTNRRTKMIKKNQSAKQNCKPVPKKVFAQRINLDLGELRPDRITLEPMDVSQIEKSIAKLFPKMNYKNGSIRRLNISDINGIIELNRKRSRSFQKRQIVLQSWS